MNIEEVRRITKQKMLVKRGGPAYAVCDYCRVNKPSHMHELVRRSKVYKGSTARHLIYQPEICSLLCPQCHENIHGGKAYNEDRLWNFNYQLYGVNEVLDALNWLFDATKTRIDFEPPMPEPFRGNDGL